MYKFSFPDNQTLLYHLSTILAGREGLTDQVELLSRNVSTQSSTFPAEIVNCKTADNRHVSLLFKYVGGLGPNNFNHRGGVDYEAEVYEKVLMYLPVTCAKFYTSFRCGEKNERCLVIEYLPDCVTMSSPLVADGLLKAAEWIGQFHALNEDKAPSFITKYDESYYRSWVKRVERRLHEFNFEQPWFPILCDYFLQNVNHFMFSPQTLIHGEFYPNNVLIKNDVVYPVDWESAAVAVGEIDLASLTEGWSREIGADIVKAYWSARSSISANAKPEDFEKRLLLARIYFQFRWMGGDRAPDFEIFRRRFDLLYRFAKEAGCD
jgi:hypothetical protein